MTEEEKKRLMYFLLAWKSSAEGAVAFSGFTKRRGLCGNASWYDAHLSKLDSGYKGVRPLLQHMLERDFMHDMMLNGLPFNQAEDGMEPYFLEGDKEACHRNHKRLAWVEAMIAELA